MHGSLFVLGANFKSVVYTSLQIQMVSSPKSPPTLMINNPSHQQVTKTSTSFSLLPTCSLLFQARREPPLPRKDSFLPALPGPGEWCLGATSSNNRRHCLWPTVRQGGSPVMPQTNILAEKDTQKRTVRRRSRFQTDSTFLTTLKPIHLLGQMDSCEPIPASHARQAEAGQ